ncbi:MAG: hypothetical protein AAB539_02360 [Patescibacteria group bacterium]
MAWDYKEEEYNKQAAADPVWKLERLILYGLRGQRLDRDLVKRHLNELKIPPERRMLLELLLYGVISTN